MISIFLTIILSQPFISGPQTALRLHPNSRKRIWVRGQPLPSQNIDSSFLALSLIEHKLFPVKPKVSKIGLKNRKLPKELLWLKGMKYPDIPVVFDKSVIKYLKWFRFSRGGRATIKDWIEKSGKYRTMILESLKRNHLPSALLYIAMIESGFNKTTRSWAGATGLWQFMKEGAIVYGLDINYWIDQRIDPELSTEAVALYFKDLFFRFNNWHIALGAYNCGYGRMLQSIRRYGTNDYWKLSKYENAIPRETRLYVPKLIAVAIADLNRDKFKLGKIKLQKPYSFKYVYFPGGISFKRIALISNIDYKVIHNLNREFLKKRTPPGTRRWPVRIPHKYSQSVIRSLKKISSSFSKYKIYKVTMGDTVGNIAKRYSISSGHLRKINQIKSSVELKIGTIILVPRKFSKTSKIAKPNSKEIFIPINKHAVAQNMKRYFYRTNRGDTIKDIAKLLKITQSEIIKWNFLSPTGKITYHMYLQIFLAKNIIPHKSLIPAKKANTIIVDSEKFINYHLKKDKRIRILYRVRKHDTLKKISRKFGTSQRFIRSLNNMRNSKVQKGKILVIYSKINKLSKRYVNKLNRKSRNKNKIGKKLNKNNNRKQVKSTKKNKHKKTPHKLKKSAKYSGKKSQPSAITINLSSKLTYNFNDLSKTNGITWAGSVKGSTHKR